MPASILTVPGGLSSANDQLTVMVQPYSFTGGTWLTYGAGAHDDGVLPQDFGFTSRLPGGADTAQFTLSRSLGVSWPDLFPFDPIEVYVGGQRIFKGRIRETPAVSDDSHSITVVAEGLRYVLLDTPLNRAWVRADLGEWRDSRTFTNCDIGTNTHTQAGAIQSSKNGSLILTFAAGATIQNNGAVGIMLDQGPWPDNYAARMEVDMVAGWTPPAGNWQTFLRSGDVDGLAGNISPTQNPDISTARNVSAAAGTQAYTFVADTDGASRSRRYVGFYLRNMSGGPIVAADNVWVRITAIRLYLKTSYASGSVSVLKPSDVIVDAINSLQNTGQVTAGLTTATPAGKVTPSTWTFPQFNTSGYKTVADVIDAANSMDGNDWWVDEYGVMNFTPPRVPGTNAPDWVCRLSGGARLSMAGASGQDMYTGVIVRGQAGDGVLVERLRRLQRPLNATPYTSDSKCPVATNPSIEVNTAGWTAMANTTMTRDTAQFHTGVASLKVATVVAGVAGVTYSGWTGNFIQGEDYTFGCWVRQGSVVGSITFSAYKHNGTDLIMAMGVPVGGLVAGWQYVTSQPFTADFTGPVVLGMLMAGGGVATNMFWLDDGPVIARNSLGVLGSRGVLRTAVLEVNNRLTEGDAYNIGQAFLSTQTGFPPFRGTLTIGPGQVRDAQSNETVHPANLKVGQLIQVADIPDPSRGGAMGRSAKIVSLTYSHSARTAQLELDNSRDWVYTLDSRLRGKVSQ